MSPQYQALAKAVWEVVKDFLRWALVGAITFLLDNAYAYFSGKNLDATTLAVIAAGLKYLDYAWHRYEKQVNPERMSSKSMGIIPF